MAFKTNSHFEDEMRRDPEFRGNLRAIVEKDIAPFVRLRAERAGEPFMPSGGRAIVVQQDGDELLIANTDFGAWIAEVGAPGQNTPASAPLRGGVHDAGLSGQLRGR